MAESANPAYETTTVNVKSMPVDAWNMAKAASSKTGETLGEWLARAIRQLAEREAGVREISPTKILAKPQANLAIPPSLSPGEVESLAQAMRLATEGAGVPLPKASARHVVALATQHLRAARGLPEPKPRVRRQAIEGKAAEINQAIPKS
jgi:hypothetical protein